MATKKPVVTNEFDPTTGELVPVATESESISFFDDDEGDGLYSFTITLEGKPVRARELSKAELNEYNRREMLVADAIQSVATLEGEEGVKALESLPILQAEAHDYALEHAISGWGLTRPDGGLVPCTPEAKKKLRPTKKAELVTRIVQRSQLGRGLGDFLGES
ncbi:hypothetical protein EON80_09530 [bacterium]|nr:MAG: hypothetical protein EON80_09530 [bacterium]